LRDIGTPIEIINLFRRKDNFLEAVGKIETQLYLAEA
jgi:predicted CoA-binding protein